MLSIVLLALLVYSNCVEIVKSDAVSKSYNSSLCKKQLETYLNDLYSRESWALQMFDASSKIPPGILTGNLVDLGQFDECLEVKYNSKESGTIKGQYCLVSFPMKFTKNDEKHLIADDMNRAALNPPGQTQFTLSICIPDTCEDNDIQTQFKTIIKKLDAVFHMDIDITSVGMCQTATTQDPWVAGDWVVIGFLAFILSLVIISTAYECYIDHYKKECAHIILLAFSLKYNGKKLTSVTNNPNQLTCLNGIRFISMLWVIYGHTFTVSVMRPLLNLTDMQKIMDNAWNMHFIGATVSVDSFFVLSGLLICYGFLQAKEKGISFNVPMFFLHRYLRLTPALAIVVLIHATIISHLGSGPYWPMGITYLGKVCQDNWWVTLLYVQNYVHTDQICVGQTWYLAVDTQLYFLSPLLLIPLGIWPATTLGISILLIILSFVSPFLVSWFYDLAGMMVDASQDPNYMKEYYYTTHARFGPWVIGFVLGYLIFQAMKNRNFKMNKLVVLGGWIISLGILITVVFAPYNLTQHKHDKLESALFNAFHRNAWALALSWVIYACIRGYGGVVNWFLSLSLFQILGRFTYSMYLVHMSMQMLRAASMRTVSYLSDANTMFEYWSYFMFAIALAVPLTLMFESPMVIIEKIIFSKGNKSKPKEAPPT